MKRSDSFFDLLSNNEVLASSPMSHTVFLEKVGEYADPKRRLHPALKEALSQKGIEKLYKHQSLVYDRFDAAHESSGSSPDLMLVSATSSGKSLAYYLPVLQSCLEEPMAHAIFVYPTKALAQDQLRKLESFIAGLGVRCALYDGDTPRAERKMARQGAQIILTNPDMLHLGILPNHENWTKVLKSLRWIVLDEMHTYAGVFGAHVSCVLHRLIRLARWHHSEPNLLGCSATIENPKEHFHQLTGRVPELIEEDSAPHSSKVVVLSAPQGLREDSTISMNRLTAELLSQCCEKSFRTLVFCKSRIGTELVLKYAQENLSKIGLNPFLIESYRAGYSLEERREIEHLLVEKKLMGLVATNALELGIDIGHLDVALLNGYPGKSSSFWQQVGRVGRGTREGFALCLAHADPLERYLVRNPKSLFEAKGECVCLTPENQAVLSGHILCAAYERAISVSELDQMAFTAKDVACVLEERNQLKRCSHEMGFEENEDRYYYPSHDCPAHAINLRTLGGSTYDLYVDSSEYSLKKLGSMEEWRAFQAAHKGAIYLHRGDSYLVKELSCPKRQVFLERAECDYFTRAIVYSAIEQKTILEYSSILGGSSLLPKFALQEIQFLQEFSENEGFKKSACLVAHAEVCLTTSVIGYEKIAFEGNSVLSTHDLDLPAQSFVTRAVRIDISKDSFNGVLESCAMSHQSQNAMKKDLLVQIPDDRPEVPGNIPYRLAASVHAAEHALMAVAPLVVGCDRGDLGSLWYSFFPETEEPVIFVYDQAPYGTGLSDRLMKEIDRWVLLAYDLLKSCPCEEGCPSCLFSAYCEIKNDVLDKLGGCLLLKNLLETRSC